MKIALSLLALLSGAFSTGSITQPPRAAPPNMVLVAGGVYRPLFRDAGGAKQIAVKSFYLDATPVTVGDYLQFVKANPAWRRSRVKRSLADESYLKNWAGDLAPGAANESNTPVTWVSWFAARAYAQWNGKRLPTVAEWERAASASEKRPDGENDPSFIQRVLRWYVMPTPVPRAVAQGPANYWGAYDLHGLVWEWVSDFNRVSNPAGSPGDVTCGAGAQEAGDVGNYPAFMRAGFRSSLEAAYCIHNLGFRCARDL